MPTLRSILTLVVLTGAALSGTSAAQSRVEAIGRGPGQAGWALVGHRLLVTL